MHFVFFLLIRKSSLYILDMSSLFDVSIIGILFHSVACLFSLLIIPFDKLRLSILL